MRNSFFLIFLFLISTNLFAQESNILKGKIKADSIEAPIHIINISAEKGTVTEKSGEFAVEVSEGDLLLFSSVQFQKKEIKVTSEIIAEGYLEIEMNKDLTELDEVKLHQLSGDLAKDIDGIKTWDARIIGFALSDKEPLTVEERKLFALTRPDDPVGALYGIISGQKKMYEKAIENNKLTTLVYKAKNLVANEFYTEELHLEENKIMDFLYYCSKKPNFKELINQNDPLILIELLKETIMEYNEFIEG
ncbi:carboxypeptidase-like regulatory domain-containing protein [Salegentibacter sp. Hel_I_6]|uniref:carboxypeptidase-like regulatory domain-containing protein n=1 Tax=Salegentibacter sp. Hel_I_6 TaxID=1250278 RepID=UPI00056959A0|nr:carboxypeptidase-like regulatory domain-containing protein [Salegentibacter sp. Hel_I_6]